MLITVKHTVIPRFFKTVLCIPNKGSTKKVAASDIVKPKKVLMRLSLNDSFFDCMVFKLVFLLS
jgi:hypothetical protein